MDARFGNLIESIFGARVVDDAKDAVVVGTLIRVASVEAPAFEESLVGCIAIVIARGGRTIATVGVRLANHFAVLASCFEATSGCHPRAAQGNHHEGSSHGEIRQ